MAAAVTFINTGDQAGRLFKLRPGTITGSGLTASTNYTVRVTDQRGVTSLPVATDESGGFTLALVPQRQGDVTVDVFPTSPTAEATVTANVLDSY